MWPTQLVDLATRLAINDHSCVNAATQWAGIAALNGPQDATKAMVEAFDKRRTVIVDKLNELPGISCTMPKGAFYAFANTSGTGMKSNELQNRFLDKAGVATVSGTSFGSHGEGYLRFSYAASLDQIETAMHRIENLLR